MACSSMKACWIGCSLAMEPKPSIVVTWCPAASDTAVWQERIGLPSSRTVQEPHCDSPQPNFGPFSCRSSDRTYNSGVLSSTSTVCATLFTVNLMALIISSQFRDQDAGPHDTPATSQGQAF